MKSYKSNNTYELELKKEIATLSKNLKSRHFDTLLILSELFLAVISILYPSLFAITFCTIPAFIVLCRLVFLRITKCKPEKQSVQDLIEKINNEAFHYALLGNELYSLFINTSESEKTKKVFYILEMCQLKNKAIGILYDCATKIPQVFSDDKYILRSEKKISLPRLLNLIDLINELDNRISDNLTCIISLPQSEIVSSENEIYMNNLVIFIRSLKRHFDISK